MRPCSRADWVIVIGSAVAGISAAIGAGAAWKAATARSQAARAASEASNAMALATQPHVDVAVQQWGRVQGAVSAGACDIRAGGPGCVARR
jgi:hypothetical protein